MRSCRCGRGRGSTCWAWLAASAIPCPARLTCSPIVKHAETVLATVEGVDKQVVQRAQHQRRALQEGGACADTEQLTVVGTPAGAGAAPAAAWWPPQLQRCLCCNAAAHLSAAAPGQTGPPCWGRRRTGPPGRCAAAPCQSRCLRTGGRAPARASAPWPPQTSPRLQAGKVRRGHWTSTPGGFLRPGTPCACTVLQRGARPSGRRAAHRWQTPGTRGWACR